jgi:hypothetical protein
MEWFLIVDVPFITGEMRGPAAERLPARRLYSCTDHGCTLTRPSICSVQYSSIILASADCCVTAEAACLDKALDVRNTQQFARFNQCALKAANLVWPCKAR